MRGIQSNNSAVLSIILKLIGIAGVAFRPDSTRSADEEAAEALRHRSPVGMIGPDSILCGRTFRSMLAAVVSDRDEIKMRCWDAGLDTHRIPFGAPTIEVVWFNVLQFAASQGTSSVNALLSELVRAYPVLYELPQMRALLDAVNTA